jgi:hypothetical protein
MVIVLSDFFHIKYSVKVQVIHKNSLIYLMISYLGGPNGNTLRSDTQSNTDRITLHSSR